jgi:uncharacterized protein (TIGR00255 family)
MTIRSMTGYATASAQADGWVVSVEAKSVNHRGLDMRVSVPRECSWLEPQVAARIRERLERGRVQLSVTLDFDGSARGGEVTYIDESRFMALCRELRELSKASATGPLQLRDVLAFRDLLENDSAAQIDRDNPALERAVGEALDGLVDSRRSEGRGIARDLQSHLDTLAADLDALIELLPAEMEAFRGRLKERVEQAVADFGAGDVDDEKLAHELAFYADKADVSEELQRARSHIDTLGDLVADQDDEEAVGKTIDFYLQELIRETNTLGSKSSSAAGTDLVISMKATVEKMREQAANIE